MKKAIILFLIVSCWIFKGSAQQSKSIVIHGRIIDSSKQRKSNVIMLFTGINLLDENSKVYIDSTYTDQDGMFEFKIPLSSPKRISFMIYNRIWGYKDSIFPSIQITKDTSIILNDHQFCIYENSLTDSICPVCHKKDMVIPIMYGLLITWKDTIMHSKKWRKRHQNKEQEFHPGGCVVSRCQPYLYCKRDSLEF